MFKLILYAYFFTGRIGSNCTDVCDNFNPCQNMESVTGQLLANALTPVSVDDSSLADTVRSAYSNLALRPGGVTQFADHATAKDPRDLIRSVTKQQDPAFAR